MTLTNTIVAKLAVAFVAISMVFFMVAPAQAQTADELQATIDALMAQIAALNSQLGSTPTGSGSTPGVCPYTWTRSLSQGATGADVMALQKFLNGMSSTQVAPVGAAGSAGNETQYYGPATAAAVSNFQVLYRDDILSPVGLVNPTGYFGPSTMAKANMLCVSAPVTGDDTTGDDDDDMTDDDDDDDVSLSGEADLDKFEIDSASDDELEEGAEDAEIAEVTIEFADGDAMISRMDVALVGSGDEQDPWDTFETISLWVDGDKVAEENADDEDNYLDEDDGSIRFSNLDIVGMEDEEVVITVAATVQGSVDGTDDGESWTVQVDALRFFDADDVATTDSTTGDLGDSVSFTIDEEGSEDELIVKTSSSDPDGTTLQLEDDSKSDWYTVFAFDLDTDDSVNDIELNEVSVNVEVSSSTFVLIVDDAELVIDGTTITDYTASSTAGSLGATSTLTFDVDGDVVIDAGDRVTAELMLRFKSLATGNEGITVMAEITSTLADTIDAEGADDLGTAQISGAATGDDHTLRTQGVDVSLSDTDAVVTPGDGSGDDYATYTIELDVTAFEQDVYISTTPATALTWGIETTAGSSTPGASSAAIVIESTGDEVGSTFEITEGSTETITITATYNPTATNIAARFDLDSIVFGSSSGTPTGQTWTATPDTTYRTSVVTIVD